MLDELVGEAATSAGRVLGSFLREVGGEGLVRGVGYAICRLFKRSPDPDGRLVAAVGIAFWLVIGGLGYYTYKHDLWRL